MRFKVLSNRGRESTFSARALVVVVSLPILSLLGLSDISTQYFKKQKINDFFIETLHHF